MTVEKRQVAGRDFWFTTERPYTPDPETGDLVEAGGYYVAFSVREPSAFIAGEIVKDDRGRAKLFPTAKEALEGGINEVKARLGAPAKTFAVGLPGGTRDVEFQAYGRLLKDRGIDLDKPRVEDSFGRKWLYVWDNRGDAEKFAAQLRKETRNPNWEVYELVPPTPATQAAAEDSGPIVILVGRQSDGNSYELVRGKLFVTPAPRNAHQEIVAALTEIIAPYVWKHALGQIRWDQYTPSMARCASTRTSTPTCSGTSGRSSSPTRRLRCSAIRTRSACAR